MDSTMEKPKKVIFSQYTRQIAKDKKTKAGICPACGRIVLKKYHSTHCNNLGCIQALDWNGITVN